MLAHVTEINTRCRFLSYVIYLKSAQNGTGSGMSNEAGPSSG